MLSSCPPSVSVLENHAVEDKLIVRPNPAKDLITIENVKAENDYIYTIRDITGKIFKQATLVKKDIDISNLSPGVYLIRVENKSETKLAKFIKLK